MLPDAALALGLLLVELGLLVEDVLPVELVPLVELVLDPAGEVAVELAPLGDDIELVLVDALVSVQLPSEP